MASLGKTPGGATAAAPSKAPSFIPPASGGAPAVNPNLAPDVAAKLAAIKEKIANQQARASNPYLSGSGAFPKKEEAERQKGGLSTVAAHPLLADLLPRAAGPGGEDVKPNVHKTGGKRERFGKTMAPKFTSVQANARLVSTASPAPVAKPVVAAPSFNPYSAAPSTSTPTEDAKADEHIERAAARRAKPTLKFVQKGKYIQQAETLRAEAKMDALRARIAEASKKAGLASEFEVLERNIKVGVLVSGLRPRLTRSSPPAAPTPARRRVVGRAPPSHQILRRPRRPVQAAHLDRRQPRQPLRAAPDPDPRAMGRPRPN